MHKYQYLVLALALIVITVTPKAACAQGYDISDIEPAPAYSGELSLEAFEKQSKIVEEKPSGESELSFRVRIPNDWRKVETSVLEKKEDVFSLKRSIIGTLAKYYGANKIHGVSRFEVEAQDMDFDMTARNWLLNYLLKNGYTLQGMTEHDERSVEVIYIVLEGDTSYVVRTKAVINGEKIILASYFMPISYWNEDRALQYHVINSFELLDKKDITIEINHTYEVLDLLKFDYPSSWQLMAPNIYDIAGIDVVLLNSPDGKTADGEIIVHLVSTELDTTMAEEVDFLREELEESRGVKVGDLIETRDEEYLFPEHTYYDKVEVYELEGVDIKLVDYEYWVALMAEDRYYYIVEMMTPSRNIDFYNWARNTEAFEVIIESFRL